MVLIKSADAPRGSKFSTLGHTVPEMLLGLIKPMFRRAVFSIGLNGLIIEAPLLIFGMDYLCVCWGRYNSKAIRSPYSEINYSLMYLQWMKMLGCRKDRIFYNLLHLQPPHFLYDPELTPGLIVLRAFGPNERRWTIQRGFMETYRKLYSSIVYF